MYFLDLLLSDFEWWREKRGGDWFHIKELMPPAPAAYWTQRAPDLSDPWAELIERKSYSRQ